MARQGHFEGAIALYHKALAIDPNDAVAYANIGGGLIEQGQFKDAIEPLQKVIKLDPKSAGARRSRATVPSRCRTRTVSSRTSQSYQDR